MNTNRKSNRERELTCKGRKVSTDLWRRQKDGYPRTTVPSVKQWLHLWCYDDNREKHQRFLRRPPTLLSDVRSTHHHNHRVVARRPPDVTADGTVERELHHRCTDTSSLTIDTSEAVSCRGGREEQPWCSPTASVTKVIMNKGWRRTRTPTPGSEPQPVRWTPPLRPPPHYHLSDPSSDSSTAAAWMPAKVVTRRTNVNNRRRQPANLGKEVRERGEEARWLGGWLASGGVVEM
ncbi:hypothetical protein C0Q70_09582 [Pomacea canaliculata]|uniref:Uncharacterized protein n=1 Tax=Pomacea canaliculata TaxID=400727 RepID=A0A2T7PA77_POMCA|nr:hypothetical protein C0Q70_09582 [Pomacea canaliculata]